MTDIQKLKALAELIPANNNIWHFSEEHESSQYQGYMVVDGWRCHVASTGMGNSDCIAAEFIAAANPAAVLELFAEIAKLRQEAQGLRGFHARQNIYLKIAEALCASDYERTGIDWDYECSLHEKIEAIRSERDQLKTENTDLHATLQAAKGEIERLKAENEALRLSKLYWVTDPGNGLIRCVPDERYRHFSPSIRARYKPVMSKESTHD